MRIKIYLNYYSENEKFKDVNNLKLHYENYKVIFLRKNNINLFLKKRYKKLENKSQLDNEDINFLSFTFKGREVKYLIKNPIYSSDNYYLNRQAYNSIRNSSEFLVSRDKLIIKDQYLKDNCNGFVIFNKKRKFKSGDYKSESIDFNSKYKTNADSLDIRANKFLTPNALDNLSKIENKNFYKIGIKDDLFLKKEIVSKLIYPIGLFKFTNLYSSKKLVKIIYKKIELEAELLLQSLEYVSFLK
ncbi:hypothetical protein [Spiroplasma endosymbiont of Atherix ibis]|uniref:hypothetical protein n=1 Tax=Spiroplasma endosymbiont of Atherix ibis TaxID=3066291 RepID=UPI0030D40D7D